LSTDFSVRGLALLPADLQKGLIGDRFHVAVAQCAGSEAGGAHRFSCRHVFLDFRADGAIVYQRSVLDQFSAMINRDLGILK